jgi:hypothetical protein
MSLFVTRRSASWYIFIIGLFLMVLGGAFLIGSFVQFSQSSILASFFFLILGIGYAMLAIQRNKRFLYLFLATLFLQVGLFLFLFALHIIPIAFSQTWPLISVFAGISLFPAGWHRYGTFSAKYVAPSVAFIILGSVLMVFSLDLVSFSLAQFVRNWWHLLVVLTGLTLTLIALGSKKTGN